MEPDTATIDPPTTLGGNTPQPAPFGLEPTAPSPTKALPTERVKITLTRIRALRAKSRNLAKAHREFLAAVSELQAGRENDTGQLVVGLEGARLDVLEGDIEQGNVRITLLAEEFESLHA